jgi:hypothetical protein
VCGERARLRRQKAARLLEHAIAYEECIGEPGYGSVEYVAGQVARLRAAAGELLEGLPA